MKAKGGSPDRGLRLRAEDDEDLAVISACLQDALVSVRDLAYDRDARTFVLVANRFRWEGADARACEKLLRAGQRRFGRVSSEQVGAGALWLAKRRTGMSGCVVHR